MSTTTYKHDYGTGNADPKLHKCIPSHLNGVTEFKCKCEPDKVSTDIKKAIECSKNCKVHCPAVKEDTNKREEKKTCPEPEWTRIAPMGALIKPRIICRNNLNKKSNVNPCTITKPNKFLNTLPVRDPELFEKIKNESTVDLCKDTSSSRLKTTYQIDYCGIPEYALGIYKNCNNNNDHSKLSDIEKFLSGRQHFRDLKVKGLELDEDDPLRKRSIKYKTINYTEHALKHPPRRCGKKVSQGKCGFDLGRGPISEYKDTTSRMGGVIIKEKLNEHQKCNKGRNCLHEFMVCK